LTLKSQWPTKGFDAAGQIPVSSKKAKKMRIAKFIYFLGHLSNEPAAVPALIGFHQARNHRIFPGETGLKPLASSTHLL
jgi:hypothetical protein